MILSGFSYFFSAGLVTHYLFIISLIDFSYAYQVKEIAINSGFYLFIFGIIFTISQRMIPFFYFNESSRLYYK